jgi:hypothetical protein
VWQVLATVYSGASLYYLKMSVIAFVDGHPVVLSNYVDKVTITQQ